MKTETLLKGQKVTGIAIEAVGVRVRACVCVSSSAVGPACACVRVCGGV